MESVTAMLQELAAGRITAPQAADWVRTHQWPPSNRPPLRSAADMWMAGERDPEPLQAGSFKEISHAHLNGLIDQATYGVLAAAYADAKRAERPTV